MVWKKFCSGSSLDGRNSSIDTHTVAVQINTDAACANWLEPSSPGKIFVKKDGCSAAVCSRQQI